MFVDTTLPATFRPAPAAKAGALVARTFTAETTENYWHGRGLYARLRKYGHGGGCIARGVPCYYGSLAAAEAAGALWVEQGR